MRGQPLRAVQQRRGRGRRGRNDEASAALLSSSSSSFFRFSTTAGSHAACFTVLQNWLGSIRRLSRRADAKTQRDRAGRRTADPLLFSHSHWPLAAPARAHLSPRAGGWPVRRHRAPPQRSAGGCGSCPCRRCREQRDALRSRVSFSCPFSAFLGRPSLKALWTRPGGTPKRGASHARRHT